MESFIGRIGGKKRLRDAIISRFPREIPGRYIEVFGGAGWVLFRKEQHPNQLEVFNDLDNQLSNLFRCIKYHESALQAELEWLPSSRTLFNDCLQQINISGLTDIQRAARYLYLIKLSFGSKGRTFAACSRSLSKVRDYLTIVQSRLNGVVIENKDFENLIKVYDRKEALFYLDPPYVGTENLYEVPFTLDDHHRLNSILKTIKGHFVLSYNDCPFVRDMYSEYNIDSVSRHNTLSCKSNTSVFNELIIRNY